MLCLFDHGASGVAIPIISSAGLPERALPACGQSAGAKIFIADRGVIETTILGLWTPYP